MVAVLLDAVTGAKGIVPFEIVGLVGGRMPPPVAADIIDELAERAVKLGAKANELALTSVWAPHRAMLEESGYKLIYRDLEMVCRDPDWGPDRPLPDGAVWQEAAPDWIDEYYRVLHGGFSDAPGAFLPSLEEVRRYLQVSGIHGRILIENGRGIGVLRYTLPDNYINAVVRAGDQKGRGIGQLIMDEARRRLHAAATDGPPMSLTVVNSNAAAVELYRRCNFEIDRDVAVLLRRFAD